MDIDPTRESPASSHSQKNISRRQRSARRLRHEAEVQLTKNALGDLEGIRHKLGLRPSQMAELLRVHPSAWTRWTRNGEAPPHIFRMLEWYVELQSWRTHKATPVPTGPQIPEALTPLPAGAPRAVHWERAASLMLIAQILLSLCLIGVILKR